MDRIVFEYGVDFADGVGQEDTCDEKGEDLLGETCHVANNVDAFAG